MFLIHLWVTCVGGESRRDGKTEAGCAALWSVEAIVGVGDDIAASPLMISPCVIVGRQSERPPLGGNKRQTRLMPCVKGFDESRYRYPSE